MLDLNPKGLPEEKKSVTSLYFKNMISQAGYRPDQKFLM